MTADEFLTDPYHFGEIAGESITKRRDSKMKKAMLSQPMNGKTDEEIGTTTRTWRPEGWSRFPCVSLPKVWRV